MTRGRSYVFTLNNYSEEDEKGLQGLDCKYLIYGREVGENGTPHLQGFVKFDNARSFSSVSKLLPRAHLETCKSVDKAIKYCRKDGDVFEKGEEPQKNGGDSMEIIAERNKRLREVPLAELVRIGEISLNQVPILKKARLILDQESDSYTHDTVRGIWIWGPPGVGKSHAAREYSDWWPKAQNKWFDGYTGQETIILDDFDKMGVCLGHYLKIWCDKWACTGEIKGGTVNLVHKRFVVTSNYHPMDLWEDDDNMYNAICRRFEIIHMTQRPDE